MKQKETPHAGHTAEALRQRRERALSRQQKRREQQKKGESGVRRAVFTRRLQKASARKAPVTLRTRGYYPFTRDFPGNVDEAGFRENRPSRKRAALRGVLWALGLAAVFCLSFTLAKAAWLVSNEPPAVTEPAAPVNTEPAAFQALHFSRSDPKIASADALIRALNAADAQIAVLEVKDAEGYVYVYDELLPALHAGGKRAAAYICCFSDSVHTWETPALAVRALHGNGEVWTDNAGAGWLNPFSAEARALLLDTVKNAAAAGFDYVVLDSVCFPADSGGATAFYAGEDEYAGTRNQVLRGFISDAVSAAGKAGTVLLTRFSSFDPDASADRAPVYGNLLGTAAGLTAADARLSRQNKNVTVGAETFADPADIPYAFTLAVGEFAVANAGDARALLCLENDATAGETVKAAKFAGVYGWILW